jgi:hypothetical protein
MLIRLIYRYTLLKWNDKDMTESYQRFTLETLSRRAGEELQVDEYPALVIYIKNDIDTFG